MGWGYCYPYNKYMQTVFLTKLSKQGSSLGVVIPKAILNTYHWQRGDIFCFGFQGGDQITLKRITDVELEKIKSNVLPDIT